MKTKQNIQRGDKVRLIFILILSLAVIITASIYSINSFVSGEISGGVLGIIIAIIIIVFAIIMLKRRNRDLKNGLPLQDERSKRVIEKATSTAFLVSLYVLLGIGFLSDDIIKFRDISQATSVIVGIMALLFLIFWAYYNRREL